MKKIFFTLVVLLAFATSAVAADIILDKQIESAKIRKDKNGNSYVMFIVKAQHELNGVTYERGTPTFAFGDVYEQAKSLKKGDRLHAVAQEREYNGSKSFTILKLIP